MAAVAFVYGYLKVGLCRMKGEANEYLCVVKLPLAVGSALLASYDKGQHLSGILGEQVWSSLLIVIFGEL